MKNLKLLLLLIFIFTQIDLKSQTTIPIIQITSSSGQKSETSITVNPIDDNHLLVGTNVCPDRIGFYYSSNSGTDWTENDNFDNEVRTDPAVAYDLLGNLFYCFFKPDYNDVSWHTYNELINANDRLKRIEIRGDITVVVGYRYESGIQNKGLILLGKR